MRVRKLLAMLAATTLTAGVGVVAMGGAPTGAAETSGYTIVAIGEEGCQLSTIDLTSGAVAPIGATAQDSCVNDLAVAPDGTVYGVNGPKNLALTVDLIRFDTSTGAPTNLGPLTGSFTDSFVSDGGITFAADGTMYVNMGTDETGCDDVAICLYRVDPATLTSTLVGPFTQGETSFFYLTAACNGTTLSTQYQVGESSVEQSAPFGDGVQAADFDQRLTSWNTTTGASTPGADLFAGLNVTGLEFDRVTGTLYLLAREVQPPQAVPDETTTDPTVEPQYEDGVSLYTLDVATGATTFVADLDPELTVDSLGIAGSCAAPAIELVPTFTG
jgi:hypothetical protein